MNGLCYGLLALPLVVLLAMIGYYTVEYWRGR